MQCPCTCPSRVPLKKLIKIYWTRHATCLVSFLPCLRVGHGNPFWYQQGCGPFGKEEMHAYSKEDLRMPRKQLTRVAFWIEGRFKIQDYSVEDFKRCLEAIQKVRIFGRGLDTFWVQALGCHTILCWILLLLLVSFSFFFPSSYVLVPWVNL